MIQTEPTATIRQLTRRLQRPLPGRPVQEPMAPQFCYGRHFGPSTHTARRAGVVFLLYWHEDQWMLPLTRRSTQLKVHAGQISLPGGALHADETAEAGALRELEEELAVPSGSVRTLGTLSRIYLFVSDFVVDPVVACCETRPEFEIDPGEVAELFELPVDDLLDGKNHGEHMRKLQRGETEIRYRAPHVQVGECCIWGATAILLAEFLKVFSESVA